MPFIVHLIETYGLLAVFVNVFLEEAGLPLPSYPVLMIAAAVSPHTSYNLAEIMLTGVIAAILADAGWVWAGRRYGMRIIGLLCKISITPDSCVRTTGALFSKVGPISLTFTRFIPGFSNISLVLAGATRVPFLTFNFFNTLGALIYVGVAVALGVLFRDAIDDVMAVMVKIGEWSSLLIVGALGLFLAVKFWQRQRLIHQLRMDRITATELREMMDNGADHVVLDVRPAELRAMEGIIPGARPAYEAELEQAIADIEPDTEVVVYCSCPNEISAAKLAQKLRQMGFTKIRPLKGGLAAWNATAPIIIEAALPIAA